jgi:hypothetical protein
MAGSCAHRIRRNYEQVDARAALFALLGKDIRTGAFVTG